jgi:site-specific DNA-cytosine methylase
MNVRGAYYNEIDPYAAAWMRNLIGRGIIAPGDVDERSIEDVTGDDLKGYGQCHFFAGIGGWSVALRLAGWPDDRPVWTGSCPCQPFSAAGAGKAANDRRHLWPQWFRLIDACRPPIIFGEQVASAAVIGIAGAEAALCDGVQEEEQGLRTDTPREGACEEEAAQVRFGRLFSGDTEANRQRFVRSDGIAAQLGGWPHVGQPFARLRQSEGALRLCEHSDRLSRSEQRNRRLGRTEIGPVSLGDFGGTEAEIRRSIEAVTREFGPTIEWPWLDLVQYDLEGAGYAVGASVLPACSVGAPHIRNRSWFVAHSDGRNTGAEGLQRSGEHGQRTEDGRTSGVALGDAEGDHGRSEQPARTSRSWRRGPTGAGFVGNPEGQFRGLSERSERQSHSEFAGAGEARNVAYTESGRCGEFGDASRSRDGGHVDGGIRVGVALGDTNRARLEGRRDESGERSGQFIAGAASSAGIVGHAARDGQRRPWIAKEIGGWPSAIGRSSAWSDLEWLACTDGKTRPTGAGLFPLAHGVQRRTSKLRAYGNAIVPQVAEQFIRAYIETCNG